MAVLINEITERRHDTYGLVSATPTKCLGACKENKGHKLETLKQETWEDFLANRAEIFGKKINTQTSLDRIRKKLEAWEAEGWNVNEIVEKSIENGWRGVFRPKGDAPNPHLSAPPLIRKAMETAVHKLPPRETDEEHALKVNRNRAKVNALKELVGLS